MNVVPYFLSETVLCNNFTGPRRVNWKERHLEDPSQFQDTDSIKYVEMEVTKPAAERVGAAPRSSKSHAVRIKFLPIPLLR